jgi:hypothetical protein
MQIVRTITFMTWDELGVASERDSLNTPVDLEGTTRRTWRLEVSFYRRS